VEDQYMFGPDLLVAPVLTEGARSRRVYLPAGTAWTDAWTDQTLVGGQWIEADAPWSAFPSLCARGRRRRSAPRERSGRLSWAPARVRFRARLVARWAVFLDAPGLEWQYEKKGYRLSNGMPYLPDFWLPDLDCWLEIGGNEPTAEGRVKARLLAEDTGYPVFVFVGLPSVSDPAKSNGFVAQGRQWVEG
jgi:hypothetical protein